MAQVSLAPMGDSDFRGAKAMDSTIDAYATRILETLSPPEACIDSESLGPYVTSLLRCEEQDNLLSDDIKNISEFESLIELLQEHCTLSRPDAEFALKSIAEAVRTGIVPLQNQHNNKNALAEFPSLSGLDSMYALGNSLQTSVVNGYATGEGDIPAVVDEEFPALSSKTAAGESANVISPLKPDNLIPVDLLGALDDPSVPEDENNAKEQSASEANQETFPSVTEASSAGSYDSTRVDATKNPNNTKKTSKKQSKMDASDLAASLFRPVSRSRQASLDESDPVSSSSIVQNKPRSSSFSNPTANAGQYSAVVTPNNPGIPPTLIPTVAPTLLPNTQQPYYDQTHMWESALEMLHSMNVDLGEDAAAQAAGMANMDVNVAQFLIDSAMTAPPICRHLLGSGCYRSDCQFSHDIAGHTCVFWVKGRCGKGESCQFLHGYNEKLLEEMNPACFYVDPSLGNTMGGYGNYSTPTNAAFGGQTSKPMYNQQASSWGVNQQHYPMESYPDKRTGNAASSSFANVASQGYDQSCFQSPPSSHSSVAPTVTQSVANVATVKIPQDVWNPHEKRDASVFHIIDPMERYRKVSMASHRNDVIDLHFQSTKTFAMVLDEVLRSKLAENQSVWIVTGTGHHVGSKTHQKGGGVLESAVMTWLTQEGFEYCRGRDRNGHGGALLVKR